MEKKKKKKKKKGGGFAEEGDGFFRRTSGHGVFFILVVDPCFPPLYFGGGRGGNIKWVDEMNGICCERFGWVLLIEQCRLACTRRERPQEAADILWLRGRAPPASNNRLIKLSWSKRIFRWRFFLPYFYYFFLFWVFFLGIYDLISLLKWINS